MPVLTASPPDAQRDITHVAARLRRTLEAAGESVQLLETHLSWVLLAGERAYKIKKPVRLDFVDFSALETRRQACHEELRLNRRLAPQLYLDVLPLHDGPSGVTLQGPGPVIEHAVLMRRFPANALARTRLAQGTLTPAHLTVLAARLAAFHRDAPLACPEAHPDAADRLPRQAAQVLATLNRLLPASEQPHCDALRAWLDAEAQRLAPLWRQRLADGFVREGHGDLHLANVLVLSDDEVTAFDGIDFDPALRWIDVITDIAFLVMDLLAHERRDLAFGFLDDYLAHTGDYAGAALLNHALVYRALVRALVRRLCEQQGVAGEGPSAQAYLRLARQLARPGEARLLITRGLPGSGKSWLSAQLLARAGALRLRSDVERQRLAQGDARYGLEAIHQTYGRLAALARLTLAAGYPTIVDATYLSHDQRQRMRRLAKELRLPFGILDCQAPMALLRERVQARRWQGGDASEADESVLAHLAQQAEPLDEAELACTLAVNTQAPVDLQDLQQRWMAQAVPAS